MLERVELSLAASTQLSVSSISRLHRRSIEDRNEIEALIAAAADRGSVLRNGIDKKNRPRRATVKSVNSEGFVLRVENIVASGKRQLFFNFDAGGIRYFFASLAKAANGSEIQMAFPPAIFEAERRDSPRESFGRDKWARLLLPGGSVKARLLDGSDDGLAIRVHRDDVDRVAPSFEVQFSSGQRSDDTWFADLRHIRGREGEYVDLGLSISAVPSGGPVDMEKRTSVLGNEEGLDAMRRRVDFAAAAVAGAAKGALRRFGIRKKAPDVWTLKIPNSAGKQITAIVNVAGDPLEAPVVVVPPAWGRTKETLLPLAETICKTFSDADESVVVVRFDGTGRRGESWIPETCRAPGEEYLEFRFSQAVEDIHSVVAYLRYSPRFSTRNVVLVTFSLAAVEGRKSVATDESGLIRGWIPVVGMADLQSGLKAVSGGVDYAYGLRRGVEFGRHELVGVLADMDLTGTDAIENQLVSLEDARRDMEKITVPISWIHGRHDAWMDIGRVERLLSAGDTRNRKLIEVPIGHQLRTSREALETFQLVSREAALMLTGRGLKPSMPSLDQLERRRLAERKRIPSAKVDLQGFWADYLLGRDRSVGIELMTSTSAYRELMDRQIELLDLTPSSATLDLGSGTGSLPVQLGSVSGSRGRVLGLDFVGAALSRARTRACVSGGPITDFAVANLDLGSACLPVASGRFDHVLASLLVSYLKSPEPLLKEARRSLRPGGNIVVSCLRRDADISKIYVDGVVEAMFADIPELRDPGSHYSDLQRQFLNDAARLLDLEEAGVFRFFNADELADLLRDAGFSQVRTEAAFGNPPQAFLAVGVR